MVATPTVTPSATRTGALAVVPVTATLAVGALIAATIVQSVVGPWFPVTSVTALTLCAAFPVIAWAGRWRGGPRGAVIAALSLVPFSGFLWAAACWGLSEPLVSMHFRCGSGDIGLAILTLPVALALTLAGVAVGIGLFGTERPALDRALRRCAWLAVVLGAVLAGTGGLRALHRPSPDGYCTHVPMVGHIPPQAGRSSADVFIVPVRGEAFTADETVLQGVRIQRRCGPTEPRDPTVRCQWQLARDGGRPLAITAETWQVSRFPAAAGIIVRRDRSHGYWLMEDPAGHLRWAFRDGTFDPADVTVRDVAHSLAPPWGWVVGTWAGVLVALGLLTRGGRDLGDLTGRWHQGHHEGGGTIRFVDGTAPATVPIGENVPVGPVVVLPITDARAAGYRDDGAPVPLRLLPGTIADLAMSARAPGVARAALALAVVALSAAPLLAAAGAGLLH